MPVSLYRHPTDFIGAYDRAWVHLGTLRQNVTPPVEGAHARLAVAQALHADLFAFHKQVSVRMHANSFGALPRFSHPEIELQWLHHLSVGQCRGIFIVRPGDENVVGLLFTLAPHDIAPLLGPPYDPFYGS